MSEPRAVPGLTPELLRAIRAQREKVSRLRRRIAVVGMSCRFPGAGSVAEFRRSLAAGRDAVTRGPRHARGPTPDRALAAYLERVDRLDAGFFRIAPVEAEVMDPQQRLLLEVSWEALEDAGLDPGKERRGGVYVGIGSADYQALLQGVEPGVHTLTGTSFAAASGRIAFTLGWTGPAIAVDTACSSSLVAIHQAIAGLQRGEADVALAGGVNVILDPRAVPAFQEAGVLARDGRCKTFDAAADGFVRGEGCGMLVLKRLGDAERDGDRILGVLLGSAVNQDGASAGLTVPNGPAQEEVIREALRRAGAPPASVDYLEAHGTGTELGDPIEAQAAGAVYGEGREPGRPLLIGSVKTNIGHLEAAAGVAGLMKVLLALQDGVIPRHLHFDTPNPRIPWDSLSLSVTSDETAWPEVIGRPRRAAVSSFSISGTNAHVVLEEHPSEPAPSVFVEVPASGAGHRRPEVGDLDLAPRARRVLPLSARSGKALRELAGRYREWLGPAEAASGKDAAERLADAAWTAGTGRSHFAARAGLVFGSAGELSEQLRALEDGGRRAAAPAGGGIAFLFTGQGSPWAGMGRALYEREPRAREVLDRCEEAFRAERGESLLPVMFGELEGLDRTEWAQASLFALSAALCELWRDVGVVPDAVLGHSVGEIGAAWAAGGFELEAGLRFAARRGALMGSLPPGGVMTAVFDGAGPVLEVLESVGGSTSGAGIPSSGSGRRAAGWALAAENGTHVVVSGPEGQVERAEARFLELGIRTERLRTGHAFHSPLMDPVLDELEAAAAELGWSAPEAAFVSGVTGRTPEPGEAPDAAYWRRQARAPVRFAAGVRALAELGPGVLIEIGPRPVLGPLAALAWPVTEPGAIPAVVASLGPKTDFPEAVAAAYEAGLPIAFEGLHTGERRRLVSLPTYPFQRERYWVKPRRGGRADLPGGHPLLGLRQELGNGEVAFETELAAPLPGWIAEHRLFGRIVAPASFYAVQASAALALQASGALARPGREAGEPPRVELDSVRIERPLFLPDDGGDGDDGGRFVQFLLGAEESASGRSWEVFSRGSAAAPWVRHATGRVRPVCAGAPDASPAIPSRRGEPLEVARLLAELTPAAAEGGLAGLWTGAEEALGESVPRAADEDGGGRLPALFEACFATVSGIPGLESSASGIADPEPGGAEATWLPVGWDLLWLCGSAAGAAALPCASSGRGRPRGDAASGCRVLRVGRRGRGRGARAGAPTNAAHRPSARARRGGGPALRGVVAGGGAGRGRGPGFGRFSRGPGGGGAPGPVRRPAVRGGGAVRGGAGRTGRGARGARAVGGAAGVCGARLGPAPRRAGGGALPPVQGGLGARGGRAPDARALRGPGFRDARRGARGPGGAGGAAAGAMSCRVARDRAVAPLRGGAFGGAARPCGSSGTAVRRRAGRRGRVPARAGVAGAEPARRRGGGGGGSGSARGSAAPRSRSGGGDGGRDGGGARRGPRGTHGLRVHGRFGGVFRRGGGALFGGRRGVRHRAGLPDAGHRARPRRAGVHGARIRRGRRGERAARDEGPGDVARVVPAAPRSLGPAGVAGGLRAAGLAGSDVRAAAGVVALSRRLPGGAPAHRGDGVAAGARGYRVRGGGDPRDRRRVARGGCGARAGEDERRGRVVGGCPGRE